MDDVQRTAFRRTHYRIDAPGGELLLKVDEPNRKLADLLRNHRATCAANLTACNPQGQLQDDVANRKAQEQLRHELVAAGYFLLTGRNEDPLGLWPVEESFLVLAISRPAARSIAAQCNQLAFLWMDATSSTPRLIETAAID